MHLSIGRPKRAAPVVWLVAALLGVVGAGGSVPLPAAHAARTYYVASYGSDLNDGLSLRRPFRHIQRCANVMVTGETCHLRLQLGP